jgi:DNA-binding response OmpR family regulator
MDHERSEATVLVVGDDAELAGLLALNLRQRGLVVEHTDLALALAPRWEPSFGRPHLLIIDVEAADHVSPLQLRRLAERPWARGVPLLLAAENPSKLASSLDSSAIVALPRPAALGAIVTAARDMLDSAAVS